MDLRILIPKEIKKRLFKDENKTINTNNIIDLC